MSVNHTASWFAVALPLVALPLAGCFPDFSGLTGSPDEDASTRDDATQADASTRDAPSPIVDARAEESSCPACDTGAESVVEAPADEPVEAAPDAPLDPCRGDGGAPGIRISSSGGDYCIDATEVSNGEYLTFVLAQPDGGAPNQPSYCSWNTRLSPSDPPNWPVPGLDSFPVASVDWCDAYAYCKWAGKRLCGRIGGGPVADIRATDSTQSQWYLACAGDGNDLYPYGANYDASKCNGVEHMSPPVLIEVGLTKSCEGHARGLFDMSGNVYEWIDACDGNTGSTDNCRMMGGGFNSPSYELACSYRAVNTRDHVLPNLGFRCCTDL